MDSYQHPYSRVPASLPSTPPTSIYIRLVPAHSLVLGFFRDYFSRQTNLKIYFLCIRNRVEFSLPRNFQN